MESLSLFMKMQGHDVSVIYNEEDAESIINESVKWLTDSRTKVNTFSCKDKFY
jgi:trehalose utilization protein